LNVCVDDAMANAVSEYSSERERAIVGQETEKLGVLAHELRNVLNTAFLSYEIIKSGQFAVAGSTGLVLGRSLVSLRNLIDRSLAEVRLDAGIDHMESIAVADFLDEVEISASLQAQARGVSLAVKPVDRSVSITGDRQTLAAALSNLLQNAFKFTAKESHVVLDTELTHDRVLFQVEDECGGLPPGTAEDLFRPYEQRGKDRSGIGLGLSICLKAARAHDGKLAVRDLVGKGCVFTLDLPRGDPLPDRMTPNNAFFSSA
jgi:signal transduction histidine kinase